MARRFLSSLSSESESKEAQHQRIVAELKTIYAEADARAKPRSQPLVPLTREEISAERLR